MKSVGVFDILGPIMVGPSSSHTAGAARLGKVARAVAGADIEDVTFYLHGSFAKTYKGHGTDRALVAGILGMEPSDLRLRDSLEIAKEMGLKIRFREADLGDVHPNTVEFVIKGKEGTYELIGSSIGGGSIEVTSVNGNSVNFTGAYPTIIISNRDVPGVVSKVTSILYDNDINIAFMKVFRNQKGRDATMVFEVDHEVTAEIIGNVKAIEGINKVIMINPIKDGE
ncbi:MULTISPECIES: L-serine ammonia-lyase, iron-sulfur-dependent subunit beta [unclassified Clostridium]|uniref:L-serine ammonia-lyase, iron-sulfur-dependent subunit beta n=1 Tax=unclassified Clostridium TaxID=2614128 RepID=UPI0018999540|nr:MULTISPECIES: L-serine ammonia-lyase, iron-sulfur-dependent subunit beta [unclassified Clostridium]MBP3916740.1 L-serine ammonia-lyase, iron-sulfur-dependent subunit beta [Clostridium sp.]MEE0931850.1 L-serine ammonia-lyase, iron-sulfur-dependent subunit beta [Clostridium sp.]